MWNEVGLELVLRMKIKLLAFEHPSIVQHESADEARLVAVWI